MVQMLCLLSFVFLISWIESKAKEKDTVYKWKERQRYYYPTIEIKTKELLHASPACLPKIRTLRPGVLEVPTSDDILNIASMPVSQTVVAWYVDTQFSEIVSILLMLVVHILVSVGGKQSHVPS